MEILLVAATPFEVAPFLAFLRSGFSSREDGSFSRDSLLIRPVITGVGMINTAWHLGSFFSQIRPALAINAGIAGSFDRGIPLGTVVNVLTERFGDLGVEEADGRFTDLFELGFMEDHASFQQEGRLINPSGDGYAMLKTVHGLSVNKVHGRQESIEAVRRKYPEVQIETMEGAAFFMACLQAGIPFLEVRSISNYVEPRNREAWEIPLAVKNLNEVLTGMLEVILPAP